MLSYNVLNSWVEKMMKKTLPVKIKTSDITTLSTKDINKLKAGDIVLKKTGNQKHAYIVSYKEDNQGICLTYNDALYTETVSYDYTDGAWVYNSTDKTVIQKELTEGDNITITDAGVISSNVPILYKHTIELYRSGNTSFSIFFDYYSYSDTPFSNNNTSKQKLINKKFLINGNVTSMINEIGIYIPVSITFGSSISNFNLRCERVRVNINETTQAITYSHSNQDLQFTNDYYIQSDTVTRVQ